MLTIVIPAQELFDENLNEFINTKPCKLQLEHSLISLSKWESKWHKPFLTKEPKTYEETLDYIKCMTLTQGVDDSIYKFLTKDNYDAINSYIEDTMTATWFNNEKKAAGSSGEQITSELIYYWMIALNIPFECQKWHLSRLLTLIKVCEIKNEPQKKMSKRATLERYKSLNEARRAKAKAHV